MRQLKLLVSAVSILGASSIVLGEQIEGAFQSQDPLLNENGQPTIVTGDVEQAGKKLEILEPQRTQDEEALDKLDKIFDESAANFSSVVNKLGEAEQAIALFNDGIKLLKQAYRMEEGSKRAELDTQAAEKFERIVKMCSESEGMEVVEAITLLFAGHAWSDRATCIKGDDKEEANSYKLSIKKYDQSIDKCNEPGWLEMYRADALFNAGHMRLRLADLLDKSEEIVDLYGEAAALLIRAAQAYTDLTGVDEVVAEALSHAGRALKKQAYSTGDEIQKKQLCRRAVEEFNKSADAYGLIGMKEKQKELLSSAEEILLSCLQ